MGEFNPTWSAAENGFPTNLEAVDFSTQLNQLLGSHGVTPVYSGTQIVTAGALTTTTGSDFFWIDASIAGGVGLLTTHDVTWPFTMPGGSTTIGRIQAAMRPIGNGADVQVTLYPDSGGLPNLSSPLVSTVVPASAISNLGASNGLPSAGPMAVAAYNVLQTGSYINAPWGTASSSAAGLLTTTATAAFGQYLLMIGGTDSNTGSSVANVFTVALSATGPAAAVPQPPLPQGLFGAGVTASADTVVVCGGFTGSAMVNSVYTATWDSNTGIISAWSAQANLPTALDLACVEIWNDSTVYVIGGNTATGVGSPTATVNYATISNGQIQSWKTGPSLPSAMFAAGSAIVGNILIVAGGFTSSTSAGLTGTYWSVINPDGSLGGWQTGPSLPVGVGGINDSMFATDSGVFIMGGASVNGAPPTFTKTLQSLSITASGLGTWQQQQFNGAVLNLPTGGFSNGDGTYTMISFGLVSGGFSNTQILHTVPMVPIPLPVTGLTAGNTYHIMFHQIGGDSNNYVQLGEVLASSSEWLYKDRYSNGPGAARLGLALLINIYDKTGGGRIIHTWEDPNGANSSAPNLATRTSTLVYDYRGRLLGECEGTQQPQNPMNKNPTFTSGISPWTVSGGTFVQSNVQTHGGFPFSGLLTPNGVSTQAAAFSEQIPAVGGNWYTANAWLYSTTGYGSVLLALNWFDANNTFIFNHFIQTSLVANTWTQITFSSQAFPGTAFLNISPAETGTPPASALLYVSNCMVYPADPNTLASVGEISYGSGLWPPTGVIQLN